MIRLSEPVIQHVAALIERYGLHDHCAMFPVPILQVARDEGWVVQYHPRMGGMTACAVIRGGVNLMFVNQNLTRPLQAVGIAHEIGHRLAGHRLSLDTHMTRGHKHKGLLAEYDTQETEANIIACMLLIPEWLRVSPLTDDEVAVECGASLSTVRYARALSALPDAVDDEGVAA
jgi:hypothetical protein